MSGAVAFRAQGLRKRYLLGGGAGASLREAIMAALSRRPRPARDVLWALDGVSFEVREGESIGILGRNGAGKSTLLKVLSRITEPTFGRIEIAGRVGSLLEVGTGFHGELTGRENIYLNGAILGMRRAEVRRKFDEIVAFAEVERFLDTPVKHYSSGMYVRLAFAVAAHLEPDILLVDEVLAVGDAAFQRKCLTKMERIGSEGRTVIFVSHSVPAVTRLCRRALLLDAGRVVCDGPVSEVVATYLNEGHGLAAERSWPEERAPGDSIARLRGVRVLADGSTSAMVDIRRAITLEMRYEVLSGEQPVVPMFQLHDVDGQCLFTTFDRDAQRRGAQAIGAYVSRVTVPGNLLAEGVCLVTAALSSSRLEQTFVREIEAVAFHVTDSMNGDAARGDYAGALPGLVRPLLPWETMQIDAQQRAANGNR